MQRRQQRSNRNVLSSRDPLGAGVAYSNSGFQDYGGIISDTLKQTGAAIDKSLQNRLAQEKFEEEKAGLMVEGFMANMSDDMDLTAIPEEDKGIITEFSMNQKQIFADAAEAASTMKAGSPEKMEQIAIMKKANQRLKNVDSQYKTWGGMREDYMQDFQNKNLSEANNSGIMIQSAGIFTGAQQRSFDEDGNIMFTDASGNVTRMSDIKQPFEKAWKQGDKINEIMMGLYSDGAELDDATRPYLRNKLDRLIDNSGVEGLQSLAFDKMVGGESFFSTEEKAMLDALDTSDPGTLIEAKKAIKEKLLDRMMDVADNRATAGFNKKQAANRQVQGPKNEGLNWLESNKAFFNQYRPGNVDDVIAAGKDDKMKVAKGNPDQIASKLNEYVSSKGFGVRYNPKNKQYVLLNSKAKQGYGSVRGEGQDGSLIGYDYNELNQMMQYIDQL
jgi:hypothetical protein